MRILLIGALSAPLIGCACPPSPHATQKALPRTAAVAPIGMKSAAAKPTQVTATSKPSLEAATRSASPNVSSRDDKTDSTIAAKIEAAGQLSDGSDPVLKKAKITVSSKMEVPASAEFADMKRAMRTDVVGQSVDTICGYVKGKTTSGETTGERPFLYLVKDDVAFVDDGKPGVAADAYRTICTNPDLHRQNFSQ